MASVGPVSFLFVRPAVADRDLFKLMLAGPTDYLGSHLRPTENPIMNAKTRPIRTKKPSKLIALLADRR